VRTKTGNTPIVSTMKLITVNKKLWRWSNRDSGSIAIHIPYLLSFWRYWRRKL